MRRKSLKMLGHSDGSLLFLDIDDTLVKSVRDGSVSYKPSLLPKPEFRIAVGGDRFSVFLRPDIGVLKPHRFNLFTAGTEAYSEAIGNGLRRLGFKVLDTYGRERMGVGTITNGPAVLIDDLSSNSSGVRGKMAALPNGKSIMVNPMVLDKGKAPSGMSMKEKFAWLMKAPYVPTVNTKSGVSLKSAIRTALSYIDV